MPNENDIKQKIVLEGEKEYNGALKEAMRNLRTLRSELKAETAELGRNATEQQKAELRAKNLKKQIAEQEKIVRACQSALDEVRKKYADNAEAIAKYETKLNSARTYLANMRNELEGLGDAFSDASQEAEQSMVETRSFAESLESIGAAAGTISDTVGSMFSGMIQIIRSGIDTAWGEITNLAARANNWIDMAGFWNTDAATIQKWAGAVREASGDLEDLNNIVRMINSKEGKTVAELTGVSSANYKDQWAYAMAVMDAMHRMDTEARNSAAFEIFGGRQATKAMDLLNDWQTVLGGLSRYDVENGGVGMTAEQMQDMSDIWDMVNGIKATWDAFKDSFVAGLAGKLTLELGGSARGILDALIDFMDADSEEDREQALKDLEENMTQFFTRLGEAISAAAQALKDVGGEMQESENGTIRAIGSVLEGLSDVLGWFADENNISSVVKGFGALAAVWGGAKMIQAVSILASLGANLRIIRSGGGIMGALFGGGAKAAAAQTATTTAAGGGLGALLGGGLKAIGGAIVKAVPWLVGAAVLAENAIKHQGNDDITDENGEIRMEMRKDFKHDKDGNIVMRTPDDGQYHPLTVPGGPQGLSLTDAQREAAEAFWDAWRENPTDFDDAAWDAFEGAFDGFGELFDELNEKLDQLVQERYPDTWRDMDNIPTEIFSGMQGFDKSSSSLDNASATLRGLPAQILAAVRAGVANITVTLDGYTVGGLIAPAVSERIARDVHFVV